MTSGVNPNYNQVERGHIARRIAPMETLTTEVARYRHSMDGFLRVSLALMGEVLSQVDLSNDLQTTDKLAFEEEPLRVFRVTSHLLTKKARLHVIAVLSANDAHNIHSLAVQMRTALECAGQMVFILDELTNSSPGAGNKLDQYLDADYYQTMKRQAKGDIDHNSLLEAINDAYSTRRETLQKVGHLAASDTVSKLEYGRGWYAHLSKCFYHSNLPALEGISYFGGVKSFNTMEDEYAFATLLDYLASQVILMIMAAALCQEATSHRDMLFDNATNLLNEKRKKAESYRETLMSMARNLAGPVGTDTAP